MCTRVSTLKDFMIGDTADETKIKPFLLKFGLVFS